MRAMYTRRKRRLGLTTKFQHKAVKSGVIKKHRPKTFATKIGAEAWAQAQGLKNYTILPAKRGKRFQVHLSVPKPHS